jgi:hypothetical protein
MSHQLHTSRPPAAQTAPRQTRCVRDVAGREGSHKEGCASGGGLRWMWSGWIEGHEICKGRRPSHRSGNDGCQEYKKKAMRGLFLTRCGGQTCGITLKDQMRQVLQSLEELPQHIRPLTPQPPLRVVRAVLARKRLRLRVKGEDEGADGGERGRVATQRRRECAQVGCAAISYRHSLDANGGRNGLNEGLKRLQAVRSDVDAKGHHGAAIRMYFRRNFRRTAAIEAMPHPPPLQCDTVLPSAQLEESPARHLALLTKGRL